MKSFEEKHINSFPDFLSLSEEDLYQLLTGHPLYAKSILNNLQSIYREKKFSDGNLERLLIALRECDSSFLDLDSKVLEEPRLVHSLKQGGIRTLRDLSEKTIEDVKGLRNFGAKANCELQARLSAIVSLATDPSSGGVSSLAVNDPNDDFFASFSEEALDLPIALQSSNTRRARPALEHYEIKTYRDLKRVGIEKISAYRNVGAKTISEMKVEALETLSRFEQFPSMDSPYQKFVAIASRCLKDGLGEADTSVYADFKRIREDMVSSLMSFVRNTKQERQFAVFSARHNSSDKQKLEEVGQSLGMTRERARQIDEKVCNAVIDTFAEAEGYGPSGTEVDAFYKAILSVGENHLVAFLSYVALYKGIEFEVLQRVLDKYQIPFEVAKSAKGNPPKDGIWPLGLRKSFAKTRFYPYCDFFDGLKSIDLEEYRQFVVKDKTGGRVEMVTDPIILSPSFNAQAFGKTVIDDVTFDGMLILDGRFGFLIKYYDSLERMLVDSAREEISRAEEVCKRRRLSLAVITGTRAIYYAKYKKRLQDVSPELERSFLRALDDENPANHEVRALAERVRRSVDTVIAAGIKLNCHFQQKPLSIWVRGSESQEDPSPTLENPAIESEAHEFTETEKDVLMACKELTTQFLDSSSRLYLGTIWVFVTGIKTSYLYRDCCEYPHFGRHPRIKKADLKTIMDRFVAMGLFEAGVTSSGKDYYLPLSSIDVLQ